MLMDQGAIQVTRDDPNTFVCLFVQRSKQGKIYLMRHPPRFLQGDQSNLGLNNDLDLPRFLLPDERQKTSPREFC